MRDDFAIFICTYGRPNNQSTFNYLRKQGYTGRIYLVLDDTDSTIQQYVDNYSEDMILVFDKQHYIDTNDTGSIPPNFKTILYAKNAVEDVAIDLGLTAFVIADDDIKSFRLRTPINDTHLGSYRVDNMDEIISSYCEFMLDNNFTALGFCNAVQYAAGIGVFDNDNIQKYRVPYNFVFRNAKYKLEWVSSFGEDIITAMEYGKVGYKMIDLPNVQFETIPPGKSLPGGMSGTYNSVSGFSLVFYYLMYNPSAMKIGIRKGEWNERIQKNNIFPKIISSNYRKDK